MVPVSTLPASTSTDAAQLAANRHLHDCAEYLRRGPVAFGPVADSEATLIRAIRTLEFEGFCQDAMRITLHVMRVRAGRIPVSTGLGQMAFADIKDVIVVDVAVADVDVDAAASDGRHQLAWCNS